MACCARCWKKQKLEQKDLEREKLECEKLEREKLEGEKLEGEWRLYLVLRVTTTPESLERELNESRTRVALAGLERELYEMWTRLNESS